MQVIRLILANLTSRGKAFWLASIFIGIIASIFEVASAATFSLLTSVLFGGRKSNLGILGSILPYSITQTVLIFSLGFIFLSKLIFQWIELHLKTKSAEEFYTSIFRKKAVLSQSEIENSRGPITNLANRMHILTHNVYYPSGLIISELLIMLFLVPFVVYISPRASMLVFGVTLILSAPILSYARRKITKLNDSRATIDAEADYEIYLDFRSYFDQGRQRAKPDKLEKQIHCASEIDRKIVKLGTYSRLTIELSFIVSVILTFSLIDELVAPDSRIQFFAVLAYSFFRVIPAFTRIAGARNQIASHQSEFFELAVIEIPSPKTGSSKHPMTFEHSLTFVSMHLNQLHSIEKLNFTVRDFVLVRGETGVGKSTLLKTIGGLRSSDYRVFVDGVELSNSDLWQPSVALVSQSPFLYGQDLVEMVTGERSVNSLNNELYIQALKISCLETWGKVRVDELTNENISGGERKQIALARAFYMQPEILLLDELTAGMDQNLAACILENIRSCVQFKLVVFASHDPVSEKVFDQVININSA
jgi:ABC-type transport system involved in cytochrome bd biosynthesis fused ATPase/permease subunit